MAAACSDFAASTPLGAAALGAKSNATCSNFFDPVSTSPSSASVVDSGTGARRWDGDRNTGRTTGATGLAVSSCAAGKTADWSSAAGRAAGSGNDTTASSDDCAFSAAATLARGDGPDSSDPRFIGSSSTTSSGAAGCEAVTGGSDSATGGSDGAAARTGAGAGEGVGTRVGAAVGAADEAGGVTGTGSGAGAGAGSGAAAGAGAGAGV